MTNYICINGKKTELTKEQLKQLGIELPKANPFARVEYGESYYLITGDGDVAEDHDHGSDYNDGSFNVANYCTDKAIMEQRALHEALNRLLWRYSMEHDGDKIAWHPYNNSKANYRIYYHHQDNHFVVDFNDCHETLGAVYFHTEEIAQSAIEEIIKPFMAAHPEFKF